MLKEYALEPSLLSSWSRFQFLVSQFGCEKGRLISRFPKGWKKLVFESLAECSPIEKKRIEESLVRIDDRLWPRGRIWDRNLDWLTNAEKEHARDPFHAIISSCNPRNHSRVVESDDADPFDPASLWCASTSVTINRTASAIADALQPLLLLARSLVLVDPHFGPENRRHRVVLHEILKRVATGLASRDWPTVRYVTTIKSTEEFFEEQCLKELPAIIPPGCTASVVAAPKQQFHNRYVLTDRGGIQLGDGLDECDAGQIRTDTLNLLSTNVASDLLRDFNDDELLCVKLRVEVAGT